MKYNLKRELPLLVILAIPFIAAIILYPHMPDRVPIHWNIRGEVDNYGSKAVGTFLLPLMNVALYLLFIILPKFDPKRENYSKFDSSYVMIRYSLHLLFLLIFGVTVAVSLGYPVNVGKWIPAGVSVLFIVMGNIMGRVKPNYYVGFRFSWTLDNEEVWKKTHKFGAKAVVIGGFAALFGVIFAGEIAGFVILMAGILIPIIITAVYSYQIHKQITQ
ncbi:MAG TPA: DUF1648 domain-containing protein [Bacillota bacterium]|nr:DUF1648 domain-containing protein [Bacillota bacterium]